MSKKSAAQTSSSSSSSSSAARRRKRKRAQQQAGAATTATANGDRDGDAVKHRKVVDGEDATESDLEDDFQLFSTDSSKKQKKKRKAGDGAVAEKDERQLFREKMNALRRQKRIKVDGSDVPAPITTFDELRTRFSVGKWATDNTTSVGYEEPTPIQMQAIPLMMKGRDIFGVAPTGSGKTAAFILPIAAKLKPLKFPTLRALVLSPTRELSAQIYQNAARLVENSGLKVTFLASNPAKKSQKKSIVGATPSTKVASKVFQTDILIATPLRLVSALQHGDVDLTRVEVLVMDEVDRLLDASEVSRHTELSVTAQVDRVLAACIKGRKSANLQRALFSATLPEHVETLAKTALRDPVRVVVGQRVGATRTVKQKLSFVGTEPGKLFSMRQLITQGLKPPVLVFVQSKARAHQLYDELKHELIGGMPGRIGVISSSCTKSERSATISKFRAGDVWLLICTDLMSRGMDFPDVSLVINFDFPPSTIEYIHRIGRTGRAGRHGEAITFFTDSDKALLRSVGVIIKQSGGEVPQWILDLPKTSHSRRRELKTKPPKRKPFSMRVSVGAQYEGADNDDSRQQKKRKRVWSKKRRDRWKNKAKKSGTDTGTEKGSASVTSR